MRVMVVDQSDARRKEVAAALTACGYDVVARLASYETLKAQVAHFQPDVILIDMDSPDRDSLEALREVHRDHPKPIVMFSDADDSTLIQDAVNAGVTAYVVDGLQAHRLKPIIEVAIARFRSFQSLRDELAETKSKLAERREIEKAKGLLMQRKGLTEDQAHQALRKLAMNQNAKLGDMARQLLTIANLLD